MICPSCRNAADLPTKVIDESSMRARETLRRTGHDNCPGATWCDCQHKTQLEMAKNTV